MEEQSIVNEQLFARLNGKQGKHLLVFSDHRIMDKDILQNYKKPNISNAITFEPGRSLMDDEWYEIKIDDTQVKEMISPYLDNASNNVNNTTISGDDYEKVVAIYKTNGEQLVLTKITNGQRIESKTFIGLNGHPEINSYNKAIEFTGQVDAYYNGQNSLYFKNYSRISSLFKGIETFYRDATVREKELFLAKSFFHIEGVDADAIGMRDSHKIAAILDDERIMLDDEHFQHRVIEYAKEFRPSLVSGDGTRLKITNKVTLHDSLNLLGERYYKSELFGDKREAIDSTKIES